MTLTAAWLFVSIFCCWETRTTYHLGPLGEPPHLVSHFDALRVLPSTHLATPPVLLIIVSTKEDNVQNALEKEFRSIRQTALATTQARSTLGHRRARHLPRSQITVRNARLTKQQKEVLVRYI